MKFKVTTTWTVEVTDEEVKQAEKGFGQPVDPQKLAVFKALEKSIEVASGDGQWSNGVSVYFDVVPVTN